MPARLVAGTAAGHQLNDVNHQPELWNPSAGINRSSINRISTTTMQEPLPEIARNCAAGSLTSSHDPTVGSAFICSVAWIGEAVHCDMNHPSIDGKDGVAGSIPAGAPHQTSSSGRFQHPGCLCA
jgi:hypothetical protein